MNTEFEWVDVNERLPDMAGKYLCCIKIAQGGAEYYDKDVLWYNFSGFHANNFRYMHDTLHGDEDVRVAYWAAIPELDRAKNEE